MKDSGPPPFPFKLSQHSQQTRLIQLSLMKLLIGLGISMGPGQASRLLSCSWATPSVAPPLLCLEFIQLDIPRNTEASESQEAP